jgi:hypothetical protein
VYAIVGFEEFGGLLMVLVLSYLDYVVSILEKTEYILAALSFLKCELLVSTSREFRKQLGSYPQLLQAVLAMPIDWYARDCFLAQRSVAISHEALLWTHGWRTAHNEARNWWINFLEALEQ